MRDSNLEALKLDLEPLCALTYRDIHRHRHTDRDIHRHRHTETETYIDTDTKRQRQTYTLTHRSTDAPGGTRT